jgi:hypothetical protein
VKTISNQDQRITELEEANARQTILLIEKDERIAELKAGMEKILLAGAKKEEQALLSIKGLMERIAQLEAFEAFLRQSQYQGYPLWRVLEWWQSSKGHADPR